MNEWKQRHCFELYILFNLKEKYLYNNTFYFIKIKN